MKKDKAQPFSPPEQAALDFMHQDFNQCFEQMRYYDNQIIGIFQFMFVAYTFLTGIITSLYQYFVSRKMDLQIPAMFTLSISLLLGVFIFAIILRNRIYFVRVARYINEQRALFLKYQPLGFENKAQMYTRVDQPYYFNWLSSQSWLIYIMAFLNAMVLAAIGLFSAAYPIAWIGAIALVFWIGQIVIAIVVLKVRD